MVIEGRASRKAGVYLQTACVRNQRPGFEVSALFGRTARRYSLRRAFSSAMRAFFRELPLINLKCYLIMLKCNTYLESWTRWSDKQPGISRRWL